MSRLRPLLLLLFLAFLSLPADAQPQPGQTFTGKVIDVIDADTYDVRLSNGRTITVRLHGVDAPETDQTYGSRATVLAKKYAHGDRVQIHVKDTDRYGRVVASVAVGDAHLGRLLVREGAAWHYDRYTPNATQLARLERQARNAGRGLWSQSNPIPPWNWRDGERSSTQSTAPSGLPYDPNGPDRDCSDFTSHAQAQRFFEAAGPGDPIGWDGDNDGRACESL